MDKAIKRPFAIAFVFLVLLGIGVGLLYFGGKGILNTHKLDTSGELIRGTIERVEHHRHHRRHGRSRTTVTYDVSYEQDGYTREGTYTKPEFRAEQKVGESVTLLQVPTEPENGILYYGWGTIAILSLEMIFVSLLGVIAIAGSFLFLRKMIYTWYLKPRPKEKSGH